MGTKSKPAEEPGYITIFRPYITTKTGKRIRRPNGRPWPIRIKVA